MKFLLNLILYIFFISSSYAENNLEFFIDSAFKNNLKLNAERKNNKSIKQNLNISRSEFLPSISLSGSQSSAQSTNRTNKNGASLADSNLDTEETSISIDQKIFQGFKGYNTLKKSELEVKQADFKLQQAEQQTILDTVSAYFDLIFKTQNEKFNISNINLFERQVESDSARLQKGEITLTDLAQSESSLAGANAKLIKAKTELLASKTNFERVTREKSPNLINTNEKINIDLPNTLQEALSIAKLNNSNLLIAKLDYKIAEKEFNIEKSRLAPSASLNYSKSENIIIGLDIEGIAVSAGAACSSGKIGGSHVLRALNYHESEANSAIRVSFGWHNYPAQVDFFLKTLDNMLQGMNFNF